MNFAGFSKYRLSEENSTAHSASLIRGLDVSPNRASAKPSKALVRPVNQKELSQMMNVETLKFLNKYFPDHYEQDIPLRDFVCAILKEYEGLWTADQATRVETQFIGKLSALLETHTYIDVIKLTTLTIDNGMIGLILTVFRRLKEDEDTSHSGEAANDIANLKNVLQEFVEGLYASLEKQLYGQFNNQMRRMILKYKETDKMIKRLNELINEHADTIHQAHYVKKLTAQHEMINRDLEKQVTKLNIALEKQQFINESLRKEVDKLTSENYKLNDKLEKCQESLLWVRRQPEHHPILATSFLSGAHAHLPQQIQPSRETSVSPKVTKKSKHLNFFVGNNKNISLGDDRSTLGIKSRVSHPNKQNFSDLQNRLHPRAILSNYQ